MKGFRFAAPLRHPEKQQNERTPTCLACRKGDRHDAGNIGLYAKFFLQFSNKRTFWRFTRLNLAAWKLPQPRKRFAFGSLLHQPPAFGVSQPASHH
jgi:hypothetical protein